MTDEIKLQREINRGNRAKALIEDDILKAAFDSLEAAYLAAWRNSHVNATTDREKLYLAVNIIGKVKEHLNNTISNGKVAEIDLKQKTEREAHQKRHAR